MPTIELSTVAFYAGLRPRSLSLWACSVPLIKHVPGALTAIYGAKSKPEAFMAASDYAQRNGFQYTVIDFIVNLEKRPSPVMKPDELERFDFLNMSRMASAMNEPIGEWICAELAPGDSRAKLLNEMPLQQALRQDPSLLGVLLESPACRHLKLIACPAQTKLGLQPLRVGVVPFRHWLAIQEATCRLDPTVHITVEPPDPAAAKLVEASSRAAAAPKP
ncbi:hypothetical protein [Azohydromonas caseinilytica]|uniref:Uncharacterized protein n=1 Tax=Azohydromonas caseinilytica TaxID=2728836 RepID=A0A848FCL2_9BURK|nr:hypothetical protein [Azohydromonas caseinilytica]NML17052.1 hypothetical protein [Azohydromonas caseinilytica]